MTSASKYARRTFLASAGAAISARMAWGQPSAAPSPQLLDDLVAANRILVDQRVVDGFGHVSVRHDKRPDRFLIARSMAPGLVTSADIMELNLDGEAIDPRGRSLYAERFIHSEIYRARTDVAAVVHSHSPGVIAFTVSKTPLRPVYHMAGFLAAGAPVFDIRDASGGDTDMLVRSPALGRALAATLDKNAAVLMRGHGYATVGANVRIAVMRAVYTEIDARIQVEAMQLGAVTYLSDVEAQKTAALTDTLVDRTWEIWRRDAMGR